MTDGGIAGGESTAELDPDAKVELDWLMEAGVLEWAGNGVYRFFLPALEEPDREYRLVACDEEQQAISRAGSELALQEALLSAPEFLEARCVDWRDATLRSMSQERHIHGARPFLVACQPISNASLYSLWEQHGVLANWFEYWGNSVEELREFGTTHADQPLERIDAPHSDLDAINALDLVASLGLALPTAAEWELACIGPFVAHTEGPRPARGIVPHSSMVMEYCEGSYGFADGPASLQRGTTSDTPQDWGPWGVVFVGPRERTQQVGVRPVLRLDDCRSSLGAWESLGLGLG